MAEYKTGIESEFADAWINAATAKLLTEKLRVMDPVLHELKQRGDLGYAEGRPLPYRPGRFHTPRIIALNGPPGSGKSTTAHALRKWINWLKSGSYNASVVSMKAPLLSVVGALFGSVSGNDYNKFKESVLPLSRPGLDVTGRDFMISFSEDCMKKLFGDHVFGTIAANTILQDYYRAGLDRYAIQSFYIIEDAGFYQEQEVLWQMFKCANYLLVRLYRDGTNFSGDSRGYISDDVLESDEDVEDMYTYNINNPERKQWQAVYDIAKVLHKLYGVGADNELQAIANGAVEL